MARSWSTHSRNLVRVRVRVRSWTYLLRACVRGVWGVLRGVCGVLRGVCVEWRLCVPAVDEGKRWG